MADRFEVRDITVPAGTLSTAPQVTNLSWREGVLTEVEFRFPPGPSGLVGLQLRHSGQTVIPWRATDWIVADAEVIRWPLTRFPTNPAWSVRAYNTGVYAHTIQIRFHLNELGSRSLTPLAALNVEQVLASLGFGLEGAGG